MLRRNNGYVPDILDCLANLSNDEVLTPPKVASAMLDMLPQEVFQSTETTFLDPFTKSGVFLREITKRLLANQVPNYAATSNEIEMLTKEAIQNAVSTGKLDLNDKDYEEKARALGDAAIKNSPKAIYYISFEKDLQAALDHILTKQVFGIAITELTAQLSRRSLYCSKNAAGKYSVAGNAFGNIEEGNIRFVPMKHTWQNGSCIYCGASASNLDRPDEYESHAYEFIHRENLEEIFMGFQFTVVCGNPPYQLSDGGNKASAKPIYHLFVEQAMRLQPRYLSMIIPARWYSGGKGLDNFRANMLNDKRITHLIDYFDSTDCFPGVDISGGVCYFLWERDRKDDCEIVSHLASQVTTMKRALIENNEDTFIRFNEAMSILNKVRSMEEPSFSEYISSRKPFGLDTSTNVFENKNITSAVNVYAYPKNGYIGREQITQHQEWIDKIKVCISYAYGERGDFPYWVIGKPFVAPVGSCCTETYLVIRTFNPKEEYKANNVVSYMNTRFFRFLVLLKKNTQHATKQVYSFVPDQDFSKPWSDDELYKKYHITKEEINFIESLVKPME